MKKKAYFSSTGGRGRDDSQISGRPPFFPNPGPLLETRDFTTSPFDDVIFGGIAFGKMSGGLDKIYSPEPQVTIPMFRHFIFHSSKEGPDCGLMIPEDNTEIEGSQPYF